MGRNAADIEIGLNAKDRGLSRSFKKAGIDATTFRGKLKLVSTGLRQLVRGDLKGLGGTLKTLGGGFGKVGLAAGAAGAAITAAIALAIVWISKAIGKWSVYMKSIVQVKRFTGMTVKQTSLLVTQMRLSGVEIGKGATGLKFFAKNLDSAQQGQKSMLEIFKRLNVDLKDSNGNWRDGAEVLSDARDRFSELEDGTEKTALAMKLFGRGGADLLPWLGKSVDEMREYSEWAKKLGLVMGEKSMKAFSEYRENQRKLSIGWEAIQVNAAGALVPLINDLMPSVIKVIWKAAEGAGKFRKLIEKKGWGQAFDEMVPGGKTIRDIIKKIWQKAKDFGQYIIDHKDEIIAAFKDIAAVVSGIATALGKAVDAARWLANLVGGGSAGSRGGGSKGQGSGFNKPDGDPSTPFSGAPDLGPQPAGPLAASVWAWIKRMLAGIAPAAPSVGGGGYGWASDLARKFGLVVSSTYRPGAITAAGYPSDHGVYGRAADIAGSPGMMGRLWAAIKHAPWLKQGLYQHEISNYGRVSYYGPTDHFDHVHVARSYGDPQTGGGGAAAVTVNVMLPAGTALIGSARQVGEIIAPHVARALAKTADRAGRRR